MPVENLTLRLVKGSPLTPVEADANFTNLAAAFDGLEDTLEAAVNPDGTLKNSPAIYGASAVGTDAYAITPSPAVAALADQVGRLIVLLADVFNTGAATLNVSALGAYPIRKFGNQALESYDIQAGQIVILSWDAANLVYKMLSVGGVVQPANYAPDAGVADHYVVAQGAYNQVPEALYIGFTVAVKAANANTGASDLQIGSIGVKAIKKNGSLAMAAGDIAAGQIFVVVYDGSNFQMVSPPSQGNMAATADSPQNIANNGSTGWNTQTLTFAHGHGVVPANVRVVLVCITTENGFAVGNEVPVSSLTSSGGRNMTVAADATNVYLRNSSAGETWAMHAMDAATAGVILNATKWQVKAYVGK